MLDATLAPEAPPVPRGFTKHACERCLERWGFWPTREQANAALLAIVERRALLMSVNAHGLERWRVRLGAVEANVVYDPVSASVVTVQAPGSNAAKAVEIVRRAPLRRTAALGPRRQGARDWLREATADG